MLPQSITEQRIKIYLLAAFVGLVAGLAAVALRYLIFGISLLFVTIPNTLGPAGWIIAPGLGGLLVGIIVIKYAPETKGHGVPEIMEAYTLRGGKMRTRTPLLKSLASAICIGSGGSSGREGPIAQIGGGVGSAIAQYLKLNARMTKTLVVCGVSAGVAATFNAPLGGFLFGIEVIAGGIVGFSVIPVILASVLATAVSGVLIGSYPAFESPLFNMGNYLELFLYLGLGIALGFLSIVWSRGFYKIEDILEKVKLSPYALPAIGGILVGGLAIIALFLETQFGYFGSFKPEDPLFPAIIGVDYAFINSALAGTVVIGALLAFGFLKALATSLTLGSGGSGGVFAPTLYIGTAVGGAFGLAFSFLFPTVVTQPMAFALVGMAALFAGTGRAPITIIVMVMEMTKDYSMILPLMIAVSTSFLISSTIEENSIYTFKLLRRGVNINQSRYVIALKDVSVWQIMTVKPTLLKPEMTIEEVLDIVDATQHTKFPVVDDEGSIIGILLTEDLFHDEEKKEDPLKVKDIMKSSFLHLNPNCTMDSVVHEMLERQEGHAVIVNPEQPNVMLGFITKADVLRAYEFAINQLQEDGELVEGISPAELVDVK
ncbi:MAG: chloride channel protein [Candidatus Thorarchaeota archaeon]